MQTDTLRWWLQSHGGYVRFEFADDLVRAFCEQRAGHTYPWTATVHRHLMSRLQSFDAALNERDILALRSLDYTPDEATRGSIRVGDTHRLNIEFLPGTPPAISIQGLTPAPPTGDRNV